MKHLLLPAILLTGATGVFAQVTIETVVVDDNGNPPEWIQSGSPSNDPFVAFLPNDGVTRMVADDIQLADGACDVTYYDLLTFAYATAGEPTYDVVVSLWDGNPCNASASMIPGSESTFTALPNDGVTFSFLPVRLPSPLTVTTGTVWMRVEFSTDDSGWVFGDEAETGFTDDTFAYDDSETGCDLIPVPAPADRYAGFVANIRCAAPEGERSAYANHGAFEYGRYFGSVEQTYGIGETEVTVAQYTEFLNAVAADDRFSLYNPQMGESDFAAIIRDGDAGSYSYTAVAGKEQFPISFVSWYDAIRFANWLHNGQPAGVQDDSTTEDGAYNVSLGHLAIRTPGARWALPTEHEWYKAAYYDPTAAGTDYYWLYPTRSDALPASEPPPGGVNSANYFNGDFAVGPPEFYSNAGAYPESTTHYETSDQGGNVAEWNESNIGVVYRGQRGGSFGDGDFLGDGTLASTWRLGLNPDQERVHGGFRVVRILHDCNANGVPDVDDLSGGSSQDCNGNFIPDECDIDAGTSADCNADTVPDECQFEDCNGNCVPDGQDLVGGASDDCNENAIPDECDIDSTLFQDRNENGVLDVCENLEIPGFLGTLVAQVGDAAPGAGGTFTSLNARPAINNFKSVAFWADSTTVEGIYIWFDGTVSPIIQVNDAIPDVAGTVADLGSEVAINDDGNVLFAASLSDGDSPRGIFLSSEDGIAPVALVGDSVPGFDATLAVVGGGLATGFTNADVVYYRGVMADEPNGVGDSGAIFRYADGATSVVAASGVAYPEIGNMSAITEGPVASDDGTVVFRANFSGRDAIIRVREGAFTEVMREGDFVPELSGCFEANPSVFSVAGPTELYFRADVGCMNPPANAVFKSDITGEISILVQVGDLSPLDGTIFSVLLDAVGNPLGDIYFTAGLAGANPGAGKFRLDQRTGEIRSLLTTGDPAPGAGGEFVDSVSGSGINDIGDWVTVYRATDDAWRLVFLDQRLLGDLDLDDDVDIDDYTAFIVCLNGPGGETDPMLCDKADLDDDGDVDMEDYALMQVAYIVCEQDGIDCNGNGVGDTCELVGSIATDCDENGTLDECDVVLSNAPDCNGNFLPDSCDIASGESFDLDQNGMPDECQGFDDCNFNGVGDVFDIAQGMSLDCDGDLIPDECELTDGALRLVAYFGDPDEALVSIDPSTGSPLEILSTLNPPMQGLASACNGDVWGLTSGGSLESVNAITGETQTVGSSPVHWIGAAYDCATDTLYGTSQTGPPFDNGLYRISTADGSAELVGKVLSPMHGLAFDSVNRRLYAMTQNGIVWNIDPDTAARSGQCFNLPISNVSGLTFSDGLLYAMDGTGGLVSIDPVTCAIQSFGNAGAAFTNVGGLAASNGTTDCNTNNVPDNCDIDSGASQDTNNDGIPDECAAPDCNANGVPDDQELSGLITMQTPQLTPFGAGFPQTHVFPTPPAAFAATTFIFTAHADLDAPNERVSLLLNGTAGLGNIYNQNSGANCSDDPFPNERTMAAGVFNDAVNGGDATITMTATGTVDPFACVDDSWISVAIEYFVSNDCNNNEILDECEPLTDCNANGVQDICDIARGISQDCNENGAPDDCDIANGTSIDCEPNGLPDECETDCNENGVSDGCDLADGTSQDCNTNSLPDECDIASGTSVDENQNGVPDECDGTLDPDMTFEFLLIDDNMINMPAINQNGSVLYQTDNDVRLVTNDGTIIKVDFDDIFGFGGHMLLNDTEQIVVLARRNNTPGWEFLRIEPEQTAADVDAFTVIADSTNAPFEFLTFAGGLANSGATAFRAEGSLIASTTFVGDGTGNIHDVNSFLRPFPASLFPETGSNTRPAMNDVGLVVQRTEVNNSEAIVGLVGPVPPNPTLDDYIIFNRTAETGYRVHSVMVVNNANNVAFRNVDPPRQVLLANGNTVIELATNAFNTTLPTGLSMNNLNEVVFQREDFSLPFARTELVITDGKTEVVVLRAGDVLDGRAVFSVTCGMQAYNDARQVTINVQYQTPGGDFKFAAYVANPLKTVGD